MTEEVGSANVVGIGEDLDQLFAEVRALRELAEDPEQAADESRVYDFSIRWGVLLAGRLRRLAHYHGDGRLTPSERSRYDALRTELRDAAPLIDRLGLSQPPVSTEDTQAL